MKMRFFDFEVFPKWWCCVIGDLPDFSKENVIKESEKDKFIIIRSDKANSRNELINLLQEKDTCVLGYNIKNYDLSIANSIYQGFTPEQVFIVNEMIINPSLQFKTKEHMRLFPFTKKKLSCIYQDLMDDGVGSLKQKECSLGLSILESSVDFLTEDLTEDEIQEVLLYCKHDVWSAMKYYEHTVFPYTQTKLALGKEFNIPEKDCHMSTNAKLCAKALNANRRSFKDAEEIEIELPNKIRNYCYENLPSKVLEKIMKSADAFHIKLFDNEVDFGNGGLHSVYRTDIYAESDDEYVLINVDAASYYPSMLIQFETLSRCVTNPEVFSNIYKERLKIKHKKDKTDDDQMKQLAYKLVLNTTFGASGNKYLDLYDPYMCTKCCRLGQIFLAALACKIHKEVDSSVILQTNTDGILVYMKRCEIDKIDKLMKEWEEVSGIRMEKDFVNRIWQKDVNNYLLITEEGKIKNKGMWLNNTIEKPGYVMLSPHSAFVCSNAAINYLVKGEDVLEHIVKDKNLHNFVIDCTKGPSFRGVVQKFSDGTEKELFKCNRVIASKDKSLGMLYKIKMYKGKLSFYKMPNIPENCKVVNDDLDKYDFKELKKEIDYMYYLERTMDILDRDMYQLKGKNLTPINIRYEL